MTKYLAASVLVLGLAGPALAAAGPGAEHFAVKDTVGNCAVVDTHPSKVSGLRILGNKGGYGTVGDAQKALGSDCKSKIDRA
jgi:hypothetical protein